MNKQQRETELSGISDVINKLVQERDKMTQALNSHPMDGSACNRYKEMIARVDKEIEQADIAIDEISKKLQLLYHSVSI